jgi:hypothetical protein
VRLGFGIGVAANDLATLVLLGSLVIAVTRRDAEVFTLGFVAFVVLKLVMFHAGRLEPDSRDPVTVMQLRRYARGRAPIPERKR